MAEISIERSLCRSASMRRRAGTRSRAGRWKRRSNFFPGLDRELRFDTTPELDAKIHTVFPFPLTAAQDRLVAEVARDLRGPGSMYRLLQGDVARGRRRLRSSPFWWPSGTVIRERFWRPPWWRTTSGRSPRTPSTSTLSAGRNFSSCVRAPSATNSGGLIDSCSGRLSGLRLLAGENSSCGQRQM